jgi:CubicO group peptidase (beta-lactamase class C family)
MKKILSSSFLLFLTFLVAFSQQPDLTKIDGYLAKTASDWGTPGISVGIVKDGRIIFAKGYGVLETGKTTAPDGNTLYAIASNTKAFTTAMLAMLVQEGKISWDDKVKKYLPYFELYDPWVSNETTIRDLLCHRVGLGTFSGDVIWYKSDLTSEEIIKRLKYLPADYDFRSGFGYSNVMYITAGEIINKVTGKSWTENLQQRILLPLGMNRSTCSLKKMGNIGNHATPHAMENGKNIPIPWTNWEEYAALGGIISSANDMCKWMILNLNNGINGKDTLLIPASRNALWKLHNNFTTDYTGMSDTRTHFHGYGLGWDLSDYQGRMRVSHSGAFDGMISSVTMIPDERLGVVVLTNGLEAPTTAMTNYVLDAFLGVKEKDWSSAILERVKAGKKRDNRISERISKQVKGTRPSLSLKNYAGNYFSDIYGTIRVTLKDSLLRLDFEHSPQLSATLEHWHYDVWKINWDQKQAWFSFGTVKFNMTNNLSVTGMDFDVPNDDIFFEELKPRRVH